MCSFLIIKPQIALHHVVQCNVVLYIYAILQVILVQFLQFVRFDEHPNYNHNLKIKLVICETKPHTCVGSIFVHGFKFIFSH